jgi:hypothetical protein
VTAAIKARGGQETEGGLANLDADIALPHLHVGEHHFL